MPSESEGSNFSTTVTPQRASTGSAQTSEDSDTASSLDGATAVNRSISRIELQSALGPDFGIGSSEPLPSSDSAPAALKEDLPEDKAPSTDSAQEEGLQAEMPGSEASGAKSRPRHYWGQALQYLDKSADVTKGMLMTRRHILDCTHAADSLRNAMSMAHVPKQVGLGQHIWRCLLSYQEICFSISALGSVIAKDVLSLSQNVVVLVKSLRFRLSAGCMLRKEVYLDWTPCVYQQKQRLIQQCCCLSKARMYPCRCNALL